MRKISKILLLSPIFIAMSSGLTSCGDSTTSELYTLKIINSEDYIFIDEKNPSNNMVEQFKRYIVGLVDEGELPEGYRNINVVYDTSDTNETLYSELQTGKSDYDLINVSDYMAQKMVSEGLVVPLLLEGETRLEKIPNYQKYASKSLRDRLDNIEAPIYSEWVNDPTDPTKKVYKYEKLEDYAVGYMWGTLGILFNPEYQGFNGRVGSIDEVINDMHYSFSALWNPKYKGTISIKNSMRDTFATGLMNAYEQDFIDLKNKLDDGTYSQKEYLDEFNEIFNGKKEESFSTVVDKVHNSLNSLKSNIFGLEVDSGKQDIVTGKIGINLAWSGDAVYSEDQAEDGTLVGENQSTLYYCVPELGSNLWFDTWVMPKNDNRSEQRRNLALMFLDFISDPDNAMQNMDYTGYTSFIGGGSVLELIRDWYDIRTYEISEEVEVQKYVYEYYDVYAFNSDIGDESMFALDYPDCMKDTHINENDDYELYYFIPYTDIDEETKEKFVVEEPENINDLKKHGQIVYCKDDEGELTETPKLYGDLLIVDSEENYDDLAVDLSYFFNDTLQGTDYVDNVDTIFYSDCYFVSPFSDSESEDYDESISGFVRHYDNEGNVILSHPNYSVGRQFFTQYPDENTINRCAVMQDFGESNKLVMTMWEDFKSDSLPVPALIIFIIIISCGLILGGYFLANKLIQRKIRKKRHLLN